MASATYRVKQLAELSGVTVRTLHHYDAIGLLTPTRRTRAGHRLYTDEDLLRLQQILVHRELGLPLERIRAILDDPGFDPRAALREQRAQLTAKVQRAEAMIRAVDAALAALEGDTTMNAHEIFDGFDPREHEAEAEQRWGDSDAYRHSQQRTAQYSADDWARIKAQTDDLLGRVAALLQQGAAPTDAAAMELAEEHREQIDRFYYPCSHAMHRGLAQLYTADERFEQSFDRHGEGVAAFLSAAIEANCQRATPSGV